MRQKKTVLSKLTRPVLPGVLRRERLFRILDACSSCPVTWISGPAGSGKTTLVADYLDARSIPAIWYQVDEGDGDPATFFYYLGLAAKMAAPRHKRPMPVLTPEYQFGVPEFANNYFAELFSRLGPGKTPARKKRANRNHVIVFDNYQLVDPASPLQQVLLSCARVMPKGLRIICISRTEPPAVWDALRMNGGVKELSGNEIALSVRETRDLLRSVKGASFTNDEIEAIQSRTQGWAAGTLLLAAQQSRPGKDHEKLLLTGNEGLFEYFAEEVLDLLDPEVRDFLLMSSFLPTMTAKGAAELTGEDNAGRILDRLVRNHFFTDRRPLSPPAYQYHPLFREFLLSQMRVSLSAEGIRRLESRAASIMEASGRIEDAAELYRESDDWTGLVRIIMTHARELNEQGRSAALERWIIAVPGEIRDGSPWLLFWLGVCKLPFAPPDSRTYFEKAYSFFSDEEDSTGIFLTWSGIVESYIYEWNDLSPLHHWIGALKKHLTQHPSFPSPEIEERVLLNLFIALALMQPWHPELPYWEKRLESLMERSANAGVSLLGSHYLMLYNVLVGNVARADRLYSALRRTHGTARPVERILSKTLEAYYLWAKGYGEESLKAVSSGLKTAHETGVHIWSYTIASIGAYTSLASGDRNSAENYFQNMERFADKRRGLDTSHYHYLRGWQALMNGDARQALEHSTVFLELNGEGGPVFFKGFNHVAAAMVLFRLGNFSAARAELNRAREIARKGKSALLEYHALLVEAEHHMIRRHMPHCLRLLNDAFSLGRKQRIFNFDWWIPQVMRQLCVLALEGNIEATYVRELIRRHNLLPDAGGPASWPWQVKVYTLGKFGIERDGKPVAFGPKAPRKPLELLKAIISLRGEVTETRLVDALWPDAAGDAGHSAFTTTVQRLRALLGGDEFVIVRDSRVSLDPQRVWVDAWAFEQALPGVEHEQGIGAAAGRPSRRASKDRGGETPQRLEAAIRSYRRPFLEDDEDKPWTAACRERLRIRYLEAVAALGSFHERAGRRAEAIEVYQKGLQVDDLAEDLYQRLMLCCLRLGKRADAVRTYKRCRAVLAASLGVEPSDETERIYRTALRKLSGGASGHKEKL